MAPRRSAPSAAPASATIHAADQTFMLTQGMCTRTAQYLAVNIGSVLLGTTNKPAPNYFGLDVGKTPGGGKPAPKDGVYPAFALSFAMRGKTYTSLSATVTLKQGRTQGSFTGKLLTGGSVTGTFKCG